MINRSQMEFHQTFQPQAIYLSEILRLAIVNFCGDKEKISEITGIPTGKQKGKVVPHLKYASFMGLVSVEQTQGKFFLASTPLGKVVFDNDKYLQEKLTKALCHFELSSENTGAPQWNYMIHHLPHTLDIPLSKEYVSGQINKNFGLNVGLTAVKGSYTEGLFEDLDLVRWNNKIVFPSHFPSYNLTALYAYTLLKAWETQYPNSKEITLEMLAHELYWAKNYNFDSDSVRDVIEELSVNRILIMNNQLLPITVLKCGSSQEFLSVLYESLL